MKLNKTSTALLLLVIIAINIVVSNCEQIKKTSISRKTRASHTRNNRITRSHSYSKSTNFILEQINEILFEPTNILYFSLGVAGEFTTESETIYKKIKPVIENFEPCYDVMKSAFKQIIGNKANEELEKMRKSESIQMIEKIMSKKENQKEFCEKTKEDISKNFIEATVEGEPNRGGFLGVMGSIIPSPVMRLSSHVAQHVVSKEEFCDRPTDPQYCPKMSAEIKKKFTSWREYRRQCSYFNELDCEVFSPEASGVWPFIKKAYSLFGLVKNTGICIVNIAEKALSGNGLQVVKDFKSLFEENGFFYKALATTIGIVANIFTFGAWGGVKGGYYLIKLAEEINKFYENKTEDLAFRIGKLVGKGIVIAKSFLFGRKKLFRRMK